MILPIYSYGYKILRKECDFVEINDNLNEIIENMFETMYNAHGVGLAAPQVGLDMNLFIVDDREGFKEVFINPEIFRRISFNCGELLVEPVICFTKTSHNPKN